MVVYYNLLAGGRFELEMQLTANGLVSLNSNSETHMTAICEARLIYGRGRISTVIISCGPLKSRKLNLYYWQKIATAPSSLMIMSNQKECGGGPKNLYCNVWIIMFMLRPLVEDGGLEREGERRSSMAKEAM